MRQATLTHLNTVQLSDYERPSLVTARPVINTPPLCDMDPKLLSPRQRKALDLMSRMRLYRGANKRYGRHPSMVGADIVMSLVGLGLARIERNTGPQPYPLLTGAGRTVLDVIEQRREKRP